MGAFISCGKPKVRKQAKILLLGSAGSGKSTILKQMRLTHGDPFSPQEIEFYRQQIFLNLTQGLKRVIDAMGGMGLEVSQENVGLIPTLNDAKDIQDNEPYPIEYRDILKRLWEDPNVQAAYAQGNEAALPDYLQYFYAGLDRFFEPSYVPTEEDIVHCYAPTTSISETRLTRLSRRECKYDLHVIDVGGQKSEWEQWVECCEDVVFVVLVVDLSGYDRCLSEDKSTNELMHAMTTWDSISRSPFLQQTSPIVLLNKCDLFSKKLRTSDIKDYFPSYNDMKCDYETGTHYFRNVFGGIFQKAGGLGREVIIHMICANRGRRHGHMIVSNVRDMMMISQSLKKSDPL